jgi:hypothetical protein
MISPRVFLRIRPLRQACSCRFYGIRITQCSSLLSIELTELETAVGRCQAPPARGPSNLPASRPRRSPFAVEETRRRMGDLTESLRGSLGGHWVLIGCSLGAHWVLIGCSLGGLWVVFGCVLGWLLVGHRGSRETAFRWRPAPWGASRSKAPRPRRAV